MTNVTTFYIYYRDQILDDPQQIITLATYSSNRVNKWYFHIKYQVNSIDIMYLLKVYRT